jgi:3-isopropylmalate/(R)-2-methylmalate dehydratase large subunit
VGQTLVEKIFSAHLARPVVAGEVVVCPVDFVFSHDGNRPQPMESFADLGGRRVFDPRRVAMFLDHGPQVHTRTLSQLHQQMRRFATDQGLWLYDIGRGISHQVLPEEGHAVPGRIIVGSDSHTTTAGAFNLLATGVGSTDLAVAMMLGRLWFQVPSTIRFQLHGQLRDGVAAKDLVLHLLGRLGAAGGTYRALEYVGEAVSALTMQQRMTLTNMAVEMGAKFGVMEADARTHGYLEQVEVTGYDTYASDPDADFVEVHDLDVSTLGPQVSVPPDPDRVRPVEQLAGTPIHQATIGTSTNGQLDDLRAAARVLGDGHVAPGVRLFVTAATRRAYLAALREGLVDRFVRAGATWGTPGCSGCTGASGFGVPADDQNMITSAPRNFVGRTGNASARIYLASPATVMASALAGAITDPRELMAQPPSDRDTVASAAQGAAG